MRDTAGTGLGFCSVLFMIFLVLKLTNHIDWSWWWVTAPLWGGFAILGIISIVIILFIIISILINIFRKR